jgi:chemotaxis protein MotB
MDDESAGVPEWVVTYGDMMSLLLTFFIMLVSLSEVVAEKKYRAILDAMQKYVGYRSTQISPPGKHFPLNAMLVDLNSLGSFSDKEDGRGGVRSESVAGQDMRVFRTREGRAARLGEWILFKPGRVKLSQQARDELKTIAEDLAGKPNKIEIRAHTSSKPLPENSEFSDKVVLTYERGRNIAAYLQVIGVAPDRIRITAAGDVDPLPPDEAAPHLEERAELLVLDTFVDEYVGPRAIPK